jgi:hypothetical protein
MKPRRRLGQSLTQLCVGTLLLSSFEIQIYAADVVARRQAITSALRWFHEWMQSAPLGEGVTTCQGERSERYEYVYCQPTGLEVDIWIGGHNDRISMTHVAIANSLNEVVGNLPKRFDHWSGPTSIVRVEIAPEELSGIRTTDTDLTDSFYKRARSFIKKLPADRWGGASVHYPWVSRGDPQYHVYVTRRGKLETVWVFDIADDSVTEYPNFYLDVARGSIPPVAGTNLRDGSKWFRVEDVPRSPDR